MAENCCGVKILDLDGKYKATGQEYLVVAEKDNNFKMPMEQIADTVVQQIIDNDTFKATVTEVYESPTPVAKVNLVDNEFQFSFGIPAGKQGDPGRDGKDGRDGIDGKDGSSGLPGIDGDTTRLVMAYKSTSENIKPATPTGGSWDYATNVVTYPEGWSGSDTNNLGYLWMSNATFSSNGTIVVPWSDPVCFSGKDGRDGVDGTNIEFVYKLTVTHLTKPNRPSGNTQASAMSDGWADHPTGVSEVYQCEWVSSHNLQQNGQWSSWSEPTIWAKWGVDGKDGDGVEYIFQRTRTGVPPIAITDNNPDQDEYIPDSAPGEEAWTNDPSGVNAEFQYEWVSKRKYDGDTHKWGNFSSPALWAKYGDNGQDGMGLRIMYARTTDSSVRPQNPDRKNINPGSSWGVGIPPTTGKEAIWAIQALVTYDNQLYLDPSLPEEEQGWQGPYLVSGVPGLDGNNFNYQVEVFKESSTQPDAPTSEDPYHPGNGWVLTPDMSTGIWWKCVALVQGETGTVIRWGAVVRISGQGFTVKGTLSSYDQLPQRDNQIGDAYIIDGNLWVWNGSEWVNAGKVQGANGNYYEYRFKRNASWETPPDLDKTQRYPTGWSNTAPALSDGKVLWATFALISGADNTLLENWCDPYYMTGMTGDNGGSGIPGVGFEVRYAKGDLKGPGNEAEAWSETMKKKRNPSGWSLDCPTLTQDDKYNYIWFIQARIVDGNLEGFWSKPNPLGGILVPDPIGKQPIAYPAGIFSSSTTYVNDGETMPYVYDTSDGNYYYLSEVTGSSGWMSSQHNNESPATNNGASWKKFEHYQAIYTDLLIAPNSLVGGAVFNNNLMFSQRGHDSSGADSTHYEKIQPDRPMHPNFSTLNPTDYFIPNMLLDFDNGDAYFCGGNVELLGSGDTMKMSMTSKTDNSKVELEPGSLRIERTGITSDTDDENFIFTVNKNGMKFDCRGSGFHDPLVINADGSGSLANGNIAWNADGKINEMILGDSSNRGIIKLSHGSFAGIEIPSSRNNQGNLVELYGNVGSKPAYGHLVLRQESSLPETKEASIVINPDYIAIIDGDYKVEISPKDGIKFYNGTRITKTYTTI